MSNPSIHSRKGVKAILKAHGLAPTKGMGQCFLINEAAARRIAACARERRVVEIGSGLGAITHPMVEICRELVAVEMDAGLYRILREAFGTREKVRLIHSDVLKLDLEEVLDSEDPPWIAVGNLPYRAASQILLQLLECPVAFGSLHIMVQKEFADRIMAAPGNKDYGRLTVIVRYHTDPERDFDLHPELFVPRPKVWSTAMTLTPHRRHNLPPDGYELFKTIVKAAFATRRKTLRNALSDALKPLGPKEFFQDALENARIDPGRRAETVDVEEYLRLTEVLSQECPDRNMEQ